MPTYDLVCDKCNYEEELFSQKIILKIENECPLCKNVLGKKPGRVTSIFRGSGFYATDHGRSQHNSYKKDKKEIAEREEFIENARKNAP